MMNQKELIIIKNYISKKRVEKKLDQNYLNFNMKINKKVIKDSIYITKKIYYNNDREIKLIQKFLRKNLILNIIKKPLINTLEEDIKNKTFEQDNKKNRNRYTPKKRKKLPFIKQNIPNDNSDFYNNQNYLPNTYDKDECYEYKNYSQKNIKYKGYNLIYNKKNNILENKISYVLSSINHITKIRKIDILKYILLLQRYFKNIFNNKNYLKKTNCHGIIISKDRINLRSYDKFIETINESKIIIKIPKKDNENKKNNNTQKKLNKIETDISYISKKKYSKYIYYIEKIQNNWRLKNRSNIINKKLRIKKCIITKKKINNNTKKILKIQNMYRKKLFLKNEKKSKIISRKSILFSKGKNIKNNNLFNDIKSIKNTINKKTFNNLQNGISYINSYNIKQIRINKNNNNLNINNDNNSINNNTSKSNISESFRENNKKEFSYVNIKYISKIYKIMIYKKNIIQGYIITKEFKKLYYEKKNLTFIYILNLFIIKNTQEFVYFLLKYNIKKSFSYPFYNKTLQRVIQFLKTNPLPSQGGEKIKKLFLKIFPNLNSIKSHNILISSLTIGNKKQLINTNIYNEIEPDFINYICSFSKYDKHLSNPTFIEKRLKNSKLISTNIFNITKFIDDEYNNLINGKYCINCYLDLNKCLCNKKIKEDYYYDEYDLDIDFDTEYNSKNKIEYDSTKCKETIINRKPRTEEIYEDPLINLIKNKGDYTERKGFNNNSKIISINIGESQLGTNSSFGTYYNSKILNKIKINIGGESNSLNNSKTISKIKDVYHKKSNKKKENLILIKNNESND